ncbi:uncharacterized protein LOC113305873 [Papaver somniferum]|uniref:uncharacterized protein LOC113305873 n=1 Tax=Papaver somniferum TaxID=3469 RepID=UPI000E701E1B|nr:uncharacterized protein LOC113305873 [Papaver somniferum]
MSGRRGTRNTRNTRGNENGEAPNFAEMMRLMTEAMTNQTTILTAFMQNHNRNHNAPPPPPPDGNVDGHIPQGDGAQAAWMNLLEKFVRLKPPIFEGSTDPLVVDKWKEDIEKIFVAMRCIPVQRQQLAVFQLSGEARNWWKNASIGLDEKTLTYAAFYERFDTRYFPAVVRHKKIKEFVYLEQVNPMLVDDYLEKYISLQRFAHFMVVDSSRATEAYWLWHGEIREISKEEKQKPFSNSKQGNKYQNQGNRNKGNGDFRSDRNNSGGWKRQISDFVSNTNTGTVNAATFPIYCYNCWDAGNKSFECTNPRRQRPKTSCDNK